MNQIVSHQGIPIPLGVNASPEGHNFALFSKYATAVTLVLLDVDASRQGRRYFRLDATKNKTGDIWHIELRGLPRRFKYCYRVDGPHEKDQGHLFNDKIDLIDPYAKSLSGREIWGQEDTPLISLFESSIYEWEDDAPPDIPQHELIIYEVHVRGFTRHSSANVSSPGTFRGMVEKLEYLKDLGVNAIELLPIQMFDELNCDYLNPRTNTRLMNYWGYDTINYFSLKTGYASAGSTAAAMMEFKDFVKACHKNGIEVILDVVFNHTGEGDKTRPVLSFKGIDNATYYMRDEMGEYQNFSGCGNTLDCGNPVVADLILEALRYWVVTFHVDGFRFDLASVLTRESDGSVSQQPGIIERISKDPVLAGKKLIAEPWDASGLYQVGGFPADARWMEWNGKYRDVVRRFSRGESGLVAEMATRIAGSEDLYGHSGRSPANSVNFITAHDGFSMFDLVSYQEKHNEENGEKNQDGSNDNFSMNFGIEGPSENPAVLFRRHQQMRNLVTILMLSQGVPMIRGGDEFGQTQNGNNNAWCQDNPTNWLDWTLRDSNSELFNFWRRMIRFRKAHPALSRTRFFTGALSLVSGLPDIAWHGRNRNQPEFDDASSLLAFTIDETEFGMNEVLFIGLNFSDETIRLELPVFENSEAWRLILSTDNPSSFLNEQSQVVAATSQHLEVSPFSIVILTKVIAPRV